MQIKWANFRFAKGMTVRFSISSQASNPI